MTGTPVDIVRRVLSPQSCEGGGEDKKTGLENDAVRVLRIVIGPHQKIPMHQISPRVIVWVSKGRLKLTFPDGKTTEKEHHAGEIEWLDAQKHAGENLGGGPTPLFASIRRRGL